MSSILIVEDMPEINTMLKEYLEKDNYTCRQAYSGSEARLLLERDDYDLVLLDLQLPGVSGEQILKEIKQQKNTPVIVISAKDSMETRVEILELGADDYICKPFALPEVMARVHVQLRNNPQIAKQAILTRGDMQLDIAAYQVTIAGNVVPLTKHEFLIVRLLMESPNQVFTKQAIYEYAWGEEYYGDERVINTHIGNIRAKFRQHSDNEYIQTIWGIGFKYIES